MKAICWDKDTGGKAYERAGKRECRVKKLVAGTSLDNSILSDSKKKSLAFHNKVHIASQHFDDSSSYSVSMYLLAIVTI
jgi:hypothetical protein